MKRIVCIILSIFSLVIPAMSQKPATPDFAYPAKVEKASAEKYRLSLEKRDYNGALRALMDLELARTAIDGDSLPSAIEAVRSFARAGHSPESATLAWLLAARMTRDMYLNLRGVYDERRQPLLPLPEDMNLWSGEQFRYSVRLLCDSALASAAATDMPMGTFGGVIDMPSGSRAKYPTLATFTDMECISILSSVLDWNERLPLTALCPAGELGATAQSLRGARPHCAQILALYDKVLKANSGNAAAYINADMERIDFTSERLYSSCGDEGQRIRRELLNGLERRFEASEYSCEPLVALGMEARIGEPGTAEIYSRLGAAIKRFPSYPGINRLKNARRSLEQKNAETGYRTVVAPGDTLEVSIDATNAAAVEVSLYRLPENPLAVSRYEHLKGAVRVARKNVTLNGAVPFKAQGRAVFRIDRPGRYLIVPAIPGVARGRDAFPVVTATALCSGLYSMEERTAVVVDPMSGAPVEGSDLYLIRDERKPSGESLGKTDVSGMRRIVTDKNGYLSARKGSDTSAPIYLYNSGRGERDIESLDVLTDLVIYKPGDTVRWVAVASAAGGLEKRPLASRRLEVIMKDANGTAVDTARLSTDALGRASGSFTVPSGRLQGNYSIIALPDGGGGRYMRGVARFMVSDYKLASYFIEFISTERQTPREGEVTLRGRAVTYAGVPLPGITVKLQLSGLPRWWWGTGGGTPFYAAETTTDMAGGFEFVITGADFSLAPNAEGAFSAVVDATSLTGESHSASTVFTRGDEWLITQSLPSDIDISHSVVLPVKVLGSDRNPVEKRVFFSVTREGKRVAGGSFLPGSEVSLQGAGSGVASFVFSLNENMTDSTVAENIALYTPGDLLPPRTEPVWIPAREISSGDTLLLGTSAEKAWVLYTLWMPDKLIERRWLEFTPGLHRLPIAIPEDAEGAQATFVCTSGYQTSVADVTVKNPSAPRPLSITIESLRDRLVPGSAEKWTIRIANPEGKAAVMLDMFNEALEEFGVHRLSFVPKEGYVNRLQIRAPRPNDRGNSNVYSDMRWLSVPQESAPGFETYGLSFAPERMYLTSAPRMMFSAVRGSMTDEAEADNNGVTADKVVEHKSMAKVEMMADVTEDSAEDTGAGEAPEPREPGFSYRKSSVPLAFFAPVLTTEEDGSVEYSFTVPDANTTWVLQAFAYSRSLATASMEKRIVAAKPVMVKPNLPRFVRTGDKVVILSQVFNTGEATTVTVTTELFNPSSGAVTSAETREVKIDSAGSATVSASLDAPYNTPFIGFRIKASAGEFADGEQALIEVLPSSEPVYDSETFYLAPGAEKYKSKLPEYPADARVTLSYCDNPVWYALAALPGLRSGETTTSPEAAAAIFSAAVSRGLVEKYPAIAEALEEWSRSDRSDDALKSMLSRNEEMKAILLQATPWMADAAGDTERMERLALLLDAGECRKTIDESVSLIEKLTGEDGGIGWTEGFGKSSRWATEMVLARIGRARTLGYMPDDKRLEKICSEALDYLEKEYGAMFTRHPETDVSAYAYIMSLWSGHTPGALGRSMISSALQRAVKEWKGMSVTGKTETALLLARFDRKAVARQILESLGEYALSSPDKGMWWPEASDRAGTWNQLLAAARAIEAYCILEPGAPQIDSIRQWLILQKQAMNWGDSPATTEIVSAILTSSPNWVEAFGEVTVKLGGKKIPVSPRLYTGELTVGLDASSASGSTLTISRKGDSPAWGAVSSIRIMPMDEVVPSGGNGLEIAKRLLVSDGPGWREAAAGDTLTVGDKVKIQLQIKSSRITDYVAIIDNRAACLEPVDQLPGYIMADGLPFYRENDDSSSKIFIDRLPQGTFVLESEMWVNNAGVFSSGIATAQSQYAPEISAHSGGKILTVGDKK